MDTLKQNDITNPPGGILIWFVIFLEIMTFTAGIYFFNDYKHDHRDLFLEMQKS